MCSKYMEIIMINAYIGMIGMQPDVLMTDKKFKKV